MTINRLTDYLGHMRQAIADAQAFTEGMTQTDFEQDKRTQQAVVMSLIVLGKRPQRSKTSTLNLPQRMLKFLDEAYLGT